MKRPIKFRGVNMNGGFEYGYLTRKKIRSSGEVAFAIATGNCTGSETVPVRETSISQFVCYDKNGREIYEGDTLTLADGREIKAEITDNIPYGEIRK